jgi:superoxide dismutase, Fe-Mn family
MFKLLELPFAADALAPAMSRETLETHHGKHHASYIKKTNEALAARADAPSALEDVVRMAMHEGDAKLFNNSAQAWNHGFFWNSLTPDAHEPSGVLTQALEQSFGSLDKFREKFVAQGEAHFASGWLWLVSKGDGALSLTDLHDAGTPITEQGLVPLLVCDLWEHAYYLDYKNQRGAMLKAFIDTLANWRFAERQYEAARAGGAGAWAYPACWR